MHNHDGHTGKDSCRKVSRRKVLRAVTAGSAFGFIALGINPATAVEDKVEIPTHKAGDEVVFSKKVPRGWVEHLDRAITKKRELVEKFKDKVGVKDFGLRSSEEFGHIGGRNKYSVHIGYNEDIKVELPDEAGNIPVISYEAPETEPPCVNDGDFDPVPGGVQISSGGAATSCCRYYADVDDDDADEACMLTCRHLAVSPDWGCNDTADGATVYQNGDEFGSVEDESSDLDTILVDSSHTSLSMNGEIEEESGSRDLSGYVTKSGTYDLEESNSDSVESMGHKTGLETGYVTEAGYYSGGKCPDFNAEGVKTTCDVADGDSGGPVYDVKYGDAYMLSHAAMYPDKTSYYECGVEVEPETWGPAAYEIRNTHGGHFVQGI